MPKTKPRPPTIAPESSEGNNRGPNPADAPRVKLAKAIVPHLEDADPDRLLTIEFVRHFLEISEWLCRKLIKDGALPAVFIGGMTRVRLGDLREFIAARRSVGKPEPPITGGLIGAIDRRRQRRRAKPPKAEARHGRRRAIKGNAAKAGEGV